MSSEIFREEPVQTIAPVFWRVVNGSRLQEPAQPLQVDEPAEPAGPSIAQQLEQKFQEGKQRGFSEAMAIARKDAEGQLRPVLDRLAQSIAELGDARRRVREETADDLVRLSITIASRILHREITVDPDAIHGLLKAAFDKTYAREVTRVCLHPAQEAAVRNFLAKAGATAIEVVADPRLDRGALLLETSQGQLDASVDRQLKEIERGLADRIDT